MRARLQSILILATAVVQLGCGESIGPPRAAPRDLDLHLPSLEPSQPEARATTVARARQRPPGISAILTPDEGEGGEGGLDGTGEELPPEWQTAPSIYDYWTDSRISASAADARGFMLYWASHATQVVRLALRFEGRQIANTAAEGAQSDLFPWARELRTDVGIGVEKDCGHVADGSTVHHAWHEPPSPIGRLTRWGDDKKTSAESAAHPPVSRSRHLTALVPAVEAAIQAMGGIPATTTTSTRSRPARSSTSSSSDA